MNISGFVPTVRDFWPGKTSFVIFFSGCNFSCPGCDSKSVIKYYPANDRDPKLIKQEIQKAKPEIDSIIFTGGEPTLQRPALLEIARYAKDQGLEIGIETNGSKPHVLSNLLFDNLLDFIALDIKSNLNPDEFQRSTRSATFFIAKDQLISDIKESLEIIRQNQDKLQVEFRSTIIPTLLFKKESLLDIADLIRGISAIWVLQRFSQENVQDRMFREINPPTYSFLETLKGAMVKAHPELRVEVRDRKCYTFPPPPEDEIQ